MTGNVGKEGGGARYGHLRTWGFNYHALLQKQPEGSVGFVGAGGPKASSTSPRARRPATRTRTFNINKTAQGILDAKDPAIRMLWVSCKNPFAQDFDRPKLEKAFDTLELVVTVDQFFNETVANSDIVLPVTTLFGDGPSTCPTGTTGWASTSRPSPPCTRRSRTSRSRPCFRKR